MKPAEIGSYHTVNFDRLEDAAAFVAALARQLYSPGGDALAQTGVMEVWATVAQNGGIASVFLSDAALAATATVFAPPLVADTRKHSQLPVDATILISPKDKKALGADDIVVRLLRAPRIRVPRRIETERLLLRPWRRDEAAIMKEAIDANLEHLREWMPWALAEPTPLHDIQKRLEKFEAEYADGVNWTLAILSRDERTVIGGTGLHPRIGPGALEIGYWLQKQFVGQGLATEAVAALTRIAQGLPGIERIEIRCDPKNSRSFAVARRLGYTHVTTLIGDTETPGGEPRDTMVWALKKSTEAAS